MSPETLSAPARKLREGVLGALRFRAFLWWRMPLAAFAGLRVRALDQGSCEVEVPFGWRSRNPFGSTYFAAHAMAAELSTGALVLLHVANQGEGRVSTLITAMQASYGKAAKATTTYQCEDGKKIAEAVREALSTGSPVLVDAISHGSLFGEKASEFRFTWSLKRRGE